MKKTWFAVSTAVLALSACEQISEPVPCPAYIPPSVLVTVRDSVTSANLTAGSTLVLRDAAGVADSVSVPAPPPPATIEAYGLGQGGTGTFSLTVRRAGYREWAKSGIKVKEGQCGAETVNVEARLQPAP